MRSSVRLALAGSAVLAGVAFASPALAAPANYPLPPATGPTMSAPQTPVGKTVTFSAGGFEPGTTVIITLSDGRTFSVVADINGRVSLTVSFSKAGNYTFTATGVDGQNNARSVSGSVAVTGATVATVSSNEGAPTTTAGTNGTSTTAGAADTGSLPFTGMELGAVAALGAATVIGGATVRIVARRRNVQA